MKLWQFFLTLGSVVGITYVTPALLALYLQARGILWPWNGVITLLTMLAFVLLLMALCLREERRSREKAAP